jgi:VWFA-related protein
MGLVRTAVLLTSCFAVCCPLEAQVQRFVLGQVYPHLPVMRGYIDVLNENGEPVADLTPANFTATLGTNPVQVTRLRPFKDSGEGVAYVFLVDVSKSISPPDFKSMQEAMKKWIANLRPGDRIAICSFGDGYRVVADFKNDKQELNSALAVLAPHDMSTHLYQAMNSAIDLEHRADADLPARRVLILLSDGKDEGSATTSQDVVQQLQISHIPIYVIGYSRLRKVQRQRYLDVLRRFAELSGGVYQESSGNNFEQVYGTIQRAILRVFIVDLSCVKCTADGKAYPLLITLSRAGRSLSSSVDVIPVSARKARDAEPTSPANQDFWKQIPHWMYQVAGLILLAVLFFFALKRGRKVKPELEKRAQAQVASTTDAQPMQPATQKGVAMTLAVMAGKERGRVYDFQLVDTLVIGRAKGCDVVLEDERVSNRHCEIALCNRSIVIYDLDSKNSTFVKGVPIRGRHKVEDEDTLLLGETELRLRFNPDEIPAR